MDPIQTMPDISSLCANTYTKKQWLSYYKNMWTRNLMARSIDVQTDLKLKSIDKESMVQTEDGRQTPVKERLEVRKMLVQDALDLIAGIDTLLAMTDEELEKIFTKEYLAVAPDMIPPVPAVQGAKCVTEAGKDGRYEQTAPGKMVCIPTDQSIEDYLKEKVMAESKKETGADVAPEAKKE